MTLIQAVQSAAAVKRFVEKDLFSHLAEVNLSAAASAMASAEDAKDKKSALWSVVNHLEAAEASYSPKLDTSHRWAAARCLLYVKALKAIIYKSLGEEQLVERELASSLQVVSRQNHGAWNNHMKDMLAGLNPANWFQLVHDSGSKLNQAAGSFDHTMFWKQLGHSTQGLDLDRGPDPDMGG